jgi:N-acetylmuramic acid 6-phosphate etherase
MQGPTRILGVEGGGTKTAWAIAEADGGQLTVVERGKLPPSNFRLTSPSELHGILSELPREVQRVGIFLAGCGTTEDRQKLSTLAREIWPNATMIAGSDRESGFAAAFGDDDGIAVNAGTGSSVTGRRGGRIENAGGWGHILGDTGGGYYLSREALRLVLRDYDLHRRSSPLTATVLQALCLNDLDELVRWAQSADKMDLAMLAPTVFAAATDGNEGVSEVLNGGARVLAQYTHAVATRLEWPQPSIKLLGGLFREHSIYVEAFRRELALLLPEATAEVSAQPPEIGAVWLAANSKAPIAADRIGKQLASDNEGLARAITEQRNPRSHGLDGMNAVEIAQLFANEERFVQEALQQCVPELARGIELVAHAFQNGGRLFYVGAGTSGRLGVLDASEIPPTFSASADLVQGIIAGGASALYRSVEGAEDEAAAGAIAIEQRGVKSGDVVCGISASGRTPFVIAALARAKTIGARSILLTCNPARSRSDQAWDLEINLPTGPEIVAGSTRLKAGTATKVALNILTTGAMVRLGKVRDNLMVDVTASNSKLRDRAARLVAKLAGCEYEEAAARLERHGWNVRAAIENSSGGL